MPIIVGGEEHPYNSDPRNYVVDLGGKVRIVQGSDVSPSKRIVLALQKLRPEIKTHGFRQDVLNAIFEDAIAQHFEGEEEYLERFRRRLVKWTGRNAKKHLISRCDVLETWLYRDSKFVPDAYLVDRENKTVVCYEVEDTHPINILSIGEYAAAWWNLEYIYWDLHLITYDIYGNSRIVELPESEYIAMEIRKKRASTKSRDG